MLIVDDERVILGAMQEYFAAHGYKVDCARDKREAETLLAERTYLVLITDLR
jgi:DNA-binding response OmpR family regulator